MRRILPYPVLSLGLFVASILLSASVAPPSLVLALLLALLAPIIMLALGVDRVRLKAPKAVARLAIDVAGDIPAGSLVQLSRAGRSELLEGAFHAARDLADALPVDGPVLALVVSCVGRRHVLGEQTEDELEPVATLLRPGSALAGFYSFGEISAGAGQRCDMHNMTLTLAALWEEPQEP